MRRRQIYAERYQEKSEEIEAPTKEKDGLLDNCPKCGRTLKKQGRHFHLRACKGGNIS